MKPKHYDKDEAQQDLARRANLPVVHGVYRHTKGGLYVPLAVGVLESLHDLMRVAGVLPEVIEATPDPGIVLVAYRSNAHGSVWMRPLDVFQERVGGSQAGVPSRPRFDRIDG